MIGYLFILEMEKVYMTNLKKALAIGVVALTVGSAATVSATIAHPAPYPIIDTWSYGVGDDYGYSNYYVETANYGSKSAVTNVWGSVKASASQKYGWAISSATKSWNDVRLGAHWDYFKF
jgi:hypothetical protein